MPRRGLAFCLLLGFLFYPGIKVKAESHIVINAFRVAGEAATDEFVELFNPGTASVDISGWQLARKSSSGTKYNLVTTFPKAVIKPKESIVVGHEKSTAEVDIYYTTGSSIAEHNTILLYSDSGKTVVDKVGFGKAGDFEGKSLPEAEKEIWGRKNGQDTGNNYNDFEKKSEGGAKDYNGICLSEIMPAPKEGDEWIEIYNSEVEKDIGGLVISDKSGSIKKYTVPKNTTIKEGEYLVFEKEKTKITLNNDTDGVVLIDGAGKVFDDTGNFEKSEKGYSYASNGEKWYWTSRPTPGKKNIIDLLEDEAVTSKKVEYKDGESVSSKKGVLPTAEVLGAESTNEDDAVFGKREKGAISDRLLGYILIGVALLGGLAYTVFINRKKLSEVFNDERKGYYKAWRKMRQKIKRR